jgi:hypothetical protein
MLHSIGGICLPGQLVAEDPTDVHCEKLMCINSVNGVVFKNTYIYTAFKKCLLVWSKSRHIRPNDLGQRRGVSFSDEDRICQPAVSRIEFALTCVTI